MILGDKMEQINSNNQLDTYMGLDSGRLEGLSGEELDGVVLQTGHFESVSEKRYGFWQYGSFEEYPKKG